MNIIEKILCILMINELKKRVHLLTPVKSKKNKDSNNASFFFLSYIIYWYLNYKNQHVLALNLGYTKSAKLYNLLRVS